MPRKKIDLDAVEQNSLKQYNEAKSEYEIRYKFQFEYYWNLYNSKRVKAPNTAGWRFNVFYPMIFQQVQTQQPRIMDGLIGPDGTDFFTLEPRQYKDDKGNDLQHNADVIQAIQNIHMETGGFYATMYRVILNMHVFGTGWLKQTWIDNTDEYTYNRYDSSDKVDQVDEEIRTNQPLWECPSPTDVWVDPNADRWSEVTYVVERKFLRLSQLQKRAKFWNQKDKFKKAMTAYLQPKSAGVASVADTTGSNGTPMPSQDPVQTIAYVYTNDDVSVLWNNYLIHFIKTPFGHHHIPFYPFQCYPDFYKFWGAKGIPAILCDINETANSILNLTLDNLSLQVNHVILKKRGKFIDTQSGQLEPGKIVTVGNFDDIQKMEMGTVQPAAFEMIEKLNTMMNQTAGSLDYLTNPNAAGGDTNKTATAARLSLSEANRRFAQIIQFNKETALMPMLEDLLKLYIQFLDKDTVSEILGNRLAEDLKYDKKQSIIWDAEYDYLISGNTSLMDKQADLENLQTGANLLTQLGFNINKELMAKNIMDDLHLNKKLLLPPTPTPPQAPQEPQGPQGPAGPANANQAPAIANATNVPQMTAGNTQPDVNAPAPQDQGAQGNGQIGLTPDQMAQLPQIAEQLGIDSTVLLQELEAGAIPGGFATLLHISQHPELIANFKASLPQQ